jgi:hypothetical protein
MRRADAAAKPLYTRERFPIGIAFRAICIMRFASRPAFAPPSRLRQRAVVPAA